MTLLNLSRPEPAVDPSPPAGHGRAVNLLSPWVLEELRVRRLRKRFAQALVVLLVVAGATWGFQRLQLSAARSDLAGEVATGDGLRLQIDALAPVTSYVADVRRRAATIRGLMATHVDQAEALAALQEALPAGSTLDTVSFTLPLPGVTAEDAPEPDAEELVATRGIVTSCPGPDPFGTRPVVSCLLLGGTAGDRQDVAELVRALAADPLFVEPFIDTTTTADGVVTFAGSVGLSPRAFTRSYDDVAPGAEVAR